MKKLLFLFLAVTLLTACDEKATDDSLSVSKDLLEFKPTGGSAEFQISTNHSWEIIIASGKTDVALSTKAGKGNANISVTLPPTNSIQDVETRLIVRTDDGSSLRNVVLLQHGHLTNGASLYVSNQNNLLKMDGKAHANDSLSIISNVAWQLKGPEWIEAYDGKQWVNLSPDRAIISGAATVKDQGDQSFIVQIRCASANTDEENRKGTLILQSAYNNADNYQIEVSQMGKFNVQANVVATLSNAIGWYWKCGIGVERIACYIGEKQSVDLTEWYQSAPDDPCGIDGLKPNTQYTIWSLGFDKNWEPEVLNRVPLGIVHVTESNQNQPLATISNVKYDGTQFTWTVRQNQYSYMFAQLIIDGTSFWADANDGYMALLFAELMHSNSGDVSNMFTHRSIGFSYPSQIPLHIATWGVEQGDNNTRMSGLISRYDTKTMMKVPARSAASGLHFFSAPLNKDEIKKSVILIK